MLSPWCVQLVVLVVVCAVSCKPAQPRDKRSFGVYDIGNLGSISYSSLGGSSYGSLGGGSYGSLGGGSYGSLGGGSYGSLGGGSYGSLGSTSYTSYGSSSVPVHSGTVYGAALTEPAYTYPESTAVHTRHNVVYTVRVPATHTYTYQQPVHTTTLYQHAAPAYSSADVISSPAVYGSGYTGTTWLGSSW